MCMYARVVIVRMVLYPVIEGQVREIPGVRHLLSLIVLIVTENWPFSREGVTVVFHDCLAENISINRSLCEGTGSDIDGSKMPIRTLKNMSLLFKVSVLGF